MGNLEIIEDIFERTKKIIEPIMSNHENPQIVPIMNYLLATINYLNGREEVSKFKKNWVKISDKLKHGIEEDLWEEYYRSVHVNIKQRLKEGEKFYNNLASFYQDTFLIMYGEAKTKYDDSHKNFGDRRREHYEYIFSTKERFDKALSEGDPAAICD